MIMTVIKIGYTFTYFFFLKNELNLDSHLGRNRDKSFLAVCLFKNLSLISLLLFVSPQPVVLPVKG